MDDGGASRVDGSTDVSGPGAVDGDPAVALGAGLADLVARLRRPRDQELAASMVRSLERLFAGDVDTLDLKIVEAALAEMGAAFRMFAPHRAVPKVTVFGSARVHDDDPLYLQARAVASDLAEAGWMVITGAGPGIMLAAMEGAGRERSLGVSITLPREQRPNPVIADDDKLVMMKYFFTRKLMLVKESRAFICLPGGFGTLDEVFELLTLTQTGKGVPVPIVFLDTPGDPYWETVDDFIRDQLVRRGLVSAPDTSLYFITEDHRAAVDEVLRFYANYDSLRYVDDLLVVRTRERLSDEQLAFVEERFGHLADDGRIFRVEPSRRELDEHDALDLHRFGFRFASHSYGELRALIDMVNAFVAG